MSLPAVLLFICFSTACGLKCKVGWTKSTDEEKLPTETCLNNEFCGRLEMIKRSDWITYFFCGKEFKFKGKTYQLCDKGKGCYDQKIIDRDDGKEVETNVCCSTDPEFSGMSSFFGTNWGLIIGIGVGVLAFFILLCLISALIAVYCCTNRRSVGREDRQTTERHRHTHKSRPKKPQKSYVASQQPYQQPRPSIVTM